KEQSRNERSAPGFHAIEHDLIQIGARERPEAFEEARRRRWHPDALQEQMVQAESEVERRVAVPRALRVEAHRAARADEDVLRAHVAVHQAVTVTGCPVGNFEEAILQVQMPRSSGDEVRLEAQGVKA